MDAYEGFASVYDELMDNIPYDKWCEYILSLLKMNGVTDGIVCELGCGTGAVTERLARAGYDMIGIDNSYDMLELANEKKSESGLSSILYLMQDMREFELYGTVGAIVCVCDSINYLTELSDITKVMRLANNYLESRGVFICDFKTRHYFRDVVGESTIAEDREDVSFIWDNYYDENSCINELALSLFIPADTDEDGEVLYRKYQELHCQRGLTVEEMRSCVTASGLELVAMYDAFTNEPANEDSERVYLIARETHQKNKHYE